MALEKQTKEGMLSRMTTKQKGTIVAMIIIVLIVIWQVVGLIGVGGGSGQSTLPATPVKPVVTQGVKTTGGAVSGPGLGGANAASQAPQQAEVRQATVLSDAQFLQQQQMTEQKYIGKINDLEDLKIQREIAETNQAIATAKLATVTAEKNISDLLTKPAAPEIPVGAYANKLATPTMQGESAINDQGTSSVAASPSAPAAPVTPTVEYTVISVSMQLGKWNAVIGYQGKLYNVTIGDILSEDNSVVTNINKNGVTLKKDGKIRKVSIILAM